MFEFDRVLISKSKWNENYNTSSAIFTLYFSLTKLCLAKTWNNFQSGNLHPFWINWISVSHQISLSECTYIQIISSSLHKLTEENNFFHIDIKLVQHQKQKQVANMYDYGTASGVCLCKNFISDFKWKLCQLLIRLWMTTNVSQILWKLILNHYFVLLQSCYELPDRVREIVWIEMKFDAGFCFENEKL